VQAAERPAGQTGTGPGIATDEAEETLLVVGVGRRRELGAERLRAPRRVAVALRRLVDLLHLVGVEAVVDAERAGEVPGVQQDVGVDEAVDRRFPALAAEDPLVLPAGHVGIVERGLHRVADVRPRGERVVVGARARRDVVVDQSEEQVMRVEHVGDDVAGRPLLAR
jgi:hypothetical protein